MKPIYKPKGRAAEYGDYAINVYTGCPHRCYYCFAPNVLRRDREEFHSHVEPRTVIIDAVRRQLEKEEITGKLIHLCFTCDPYPRGINSTATREIIKAIKESGNYVQILTKGDGSRDFDLLDGSDWYGVTYAGYQNLASNISPDEPGSSSPAHRLNVLKQARQSGIKTWVSCEPVLDAGDVLWLLQRTDYINLYKIGKLNYHPSDINWAAFGKEAERICIAKGHNYIIKDDLRREMEKDGDSNASK